MISANKKVDKRRIIVLDDLDIAPYDPWNGPFWLGGPLFLTAGMSNQADFVNIKVTSFNNTSLLLSMSPL